MDLYINELMEYNYLMCELTELTQINNFDM